MEFCFYQLRERTDVSSVDVQSLHHNKLPCYSSFTGILQQKQKYVGIKRLSQNKPYRTELNNYLNENTVIKKISCSSDNHSKARRLKYNLTVEVTNLCRPVLTFWSSSSCSLSSLSRSSMSLCLKYLMKLREAWRPFCIEKQAASSLNTKHE